MDLVSLAAKLSAIDRPEIEKRGAELASSIIRHLLYLARDIDQLPEDVQKEYWEILRSSLEGLSGFPPVDISPSLFQLLVDRAPTDVRSTIEHSVLAPASGVTA